MKTPEIKILAASLLLFMTASAQALEPEVLYSFQLGPQNPYASLVQGSGGNFYGTTALGGFGYGTVFQVTPNGVLTTLVPFSGTNGAYPQAGLVVGTDGNFYGTTSGLNPNGGNVGYGTVFQLTTNGVLTTLVSFNNTNGAVPLGGLLLGSDGNFYGTTSGLNPSGGIVGLGAVFQVTPNGVLTTLVSFTDPNVANPQAGLVMGRDGNFYGTTSGGLGTVFKVTTNGVLTTLVSFTAINGWHPVASLVLGSDGNFYGTTFAGGTADLGTVFKMTTNGVLTTLVSFKNTDGARPSAGLVLGRDGNFYGTTAGGGGNGGFGYGKVFKVTSNGVLTTLVSFPGGYSANPAAGLVMGSDGKFYGTTSQGGSTNVGTVFKVTTNGVLTTLASFNFLNGANPQAALVLGKDGKLYGTTVGGGSPNLGTVFRVTTNGLLTTMATFIGANGANPHAALVLGRDGKFYGTTSAGGSGAGCQGGCGTVFKVTTNGVLTTLVSFNYTNGADPVGALLLGPDGNFYGTTSGGGTFGSGTVFQVTTNGVLTTTGSFNYANGANPLAGLVLGNDGQLYGTTSEGGTGGGFGGVGFGTVFQLTTNGVGTTIGYSFHGRGDGAYPSDALVLGSDGNLYGTTSGCDVGGCVGDGTVFQVTSNGVLTTLVSFSGANGANPQAGLVLGSDGNFYGTTYLGGPGGVGTIFRLVMPRFTSVARLPGGSILLTGAGPANEGYHLWTSPNVSLPFASWTLLASNAFDSHSSFTYTDAGAAANASRFYQLTVP